MEPLVHIDEVMGTQRWVTITARGSLLHKLTTKHLNANKSDSRLVKATKCAMLSKLQDHHMDLDSSKKTTYQQKVTSLDPRFRALSYLPEQATEEIKTWLEIKQFLLALYCMRKMLQWKIQDLIHQQRRELRIVRMTYCSCLRMLPTQHLNQVRP